MEPTYRVVFQGELLAGFELSAVKLSATQRLKAPPPMVEQLFSGRRVILKKGISMETGSRYIGELQSMGMKATLEAEEAGSLPQVSVATETTAQARPAADTMPALVLPTAPHPLDAPVQDLGAYAPPTEAAPDMPSPAASFGVPDQALNPLSAMAGEEATVFVPRQPVFASASITDGPIEPTVFVPHAKTTPTMADMVARLPENFPGEATIVVPRAAREPNVIQGTPADQTIVVPRKPAEASSLTPELRLPGDEATVFVPRSANPDMGATLPAHVPAEVTLIVPRQANGLHQTSDGEQTLFVPRNKESRLETGFDAERSLIAGAETLAQYFSASATTSPNTDEPALLEDSDLPAGRQESVTINNRGSDDKTEIVNEHQYPAVSPGRRQAPAPSKASSDTTVFVPLPRRGSSDPTVMASLDEPLGSDADYGEGRPAKSRSPALLIAVLVLAALGAAAYFYLVMR